MLECDPLPNACTLYQATGNYDCVCTADRSTEDNIMVLLPVVGDDDVLFESGGLVEVEVRCNTDTGLYTIIHDSDPLREDVRTILCIEP